VLWSQEACSTYLRILKRCLGWVTRHENRIGNTVVARFESPATKSAGLRPVIFVGARSSGSDRGRSFVIPMVGFFGADGLAFIVVGLYIGGIMCIANVLIALIGLARRENPRWPAITGLALSVLPALGGVYLLCGAPW
jgi:hypothetical protein